MNESPVQAGDVLGQKYRVDRVLGVGGMGVVVSATHLHLEQKVALKFMLPAAFGNPEALARFQREARAAVRLKSEHVAKVLDTGVFENNSPYIVMEYLEGTDLAGELERHGPLPLRTVAEYMIHACDALAEAHSLGIVHRDLKPANLFLTNRADGTPMVKVLDFGISKVNSLTESGLGMTKTSSMMGSPLYMSPEQMRSAKDVDQRTDVWSLGIIMYELLGGRVPFNSDTLGGLLSMVMMEPHAPLETVRPDVPRDVCLLVNHCLEKDVNRRAASVADIARALAPFCPTRALPLVDRIVTLTGGVPAGTGSPLASTGVQGGPLGTPVAQTAPGWGATGPGPAPASKSSTGVIVGGAVAVLAIAGLVVGGVALKARAAASPDQAASASAAATAAPPSSPVSTLAAATTAAATTPPSPSVSATPSALPTAAAAATPARTRGKPVHSAAPPVASVPVAKPTGPAVTSSTTKPGLFDTSN